MYSPSLTPICMVPQSANKTLHVHALLAGMKTELEEMKIKSSETAEKLKERNRQYQKLQVCSYICM